MQRIVSIDLLRGIAAFGIVGCHLALSPCDYAGHFIDMNVGVFAALSGYLMARSTNVQWWCYVRKRADRLLPTYFFWTVVYLLLSAAFQYVCSGAVKPRYGMSDFWVGVIFCGGASCHLWFLICLFYAQCLLLVVLGLRKLSGGFFLLAGFMLVIVSAIVGGWYGNYFLRLTAFLISGCGLALCRCRICGRVPWLIVAIALALHVVFSGQVPGFVLDWFVVVPVIVAFSGLQLEGYWAYAADILGKTSMGVYLIHPLATAGFGVIVRKVFMQPFGVIPVVFDWMICWLFALLVTVIMMRF